MFIFMELISSLGTKRTQGLVKGVDKSAVKISIDFKHSWETKVEVGGVQLLNLLVMQDGDDKNAYLDILKSNEAETNSNIENSEYNVKTIQDQNTNSILIAYALHTSQKTSSSQFQTSSMKVKYLKVDDSDILASKHPDQTASSTQSL